jgi:hypothetical protein
VQTLQTNIVTTTPTEYVLYSSKTNQMCKYLYSSCFQVPYPPSNLPVSLSVPKPTQLCACALCFSAPTHDTSTRGPGLNKVRLTQAGSKPHQE